MSIIDDAMVEAAGAVLLHCPLSDAALRKILEAVEPLIGAKLASEMYDHDSAARIRELTGAKG